MDGSRLNGSAHTLCGATWVDRRSNRRSFGRRLLILGVLVGALALAAPAADRHATIGSDQDALFDGVTVDRLIEMTLDWRNLPVSVDTLALARVTLSPGAVATVAGAAHLFVVEAGVFTVQEFARGYLPPTGTPGAIHVEGPAGASVTHELGDQFSDASRSASPPEISNTGDEVAVALVVSISATEGSGINDAFTGWGAVEPLAIVDAVRVSGSLGEAGKLGAAPVSVALDRVRYDLGATRDFIWDDPTARVFAVESGELNVLVVDPALHWSADGEPRQVGATARVSLVPGDLLLVPAPGRVATRNTGRDPMAVLIVTVGTALG